MASDPYYSISPLSSQQNQSTCWITSVRVATSRYSGSKSGPMAKFNNLIPNSLISEIICGKMFT